MIEYHNIKLFFQTFTLQTGLKNVLWLKKLEIVFRGIYAFSNFNGEEIDGTFFKEWNNKKCWKLIRNAEKSKFTYNDWGIAFNGKVFCSFWC